MQAVARSSYKATGTRSFIEISGFYPGKPRAARRLIRYLRAYPRDICDSNMSMKLKLLTLLIVAGLGGGSVSCLAQAETPAPASAAKSAVDAPEVSGARIEFARIVFDFG